MSIFLKPLEQQVVVITGASSGIGLATAEAAAIRGASLVLAARSERVLSDTVAQFNARGVSAVSVVADVSDRQQVEAIADMALQQFGRIDTWVNNAGVSIYGRLDEVRDEDNRRLFDINFWGVVNGSLVALEQLRFTGGAIINLGSELSEAVAPYQGMYAASKYAVKGFTDALRLELQDIDKAPVSITLIQPTVVDTPRSEHACNYLDQEPRFPWPQVQPEQVAQAILRAAESPIRDVTVGAAARLSNFAGKPASAGGEAYEDGDEGAGAQARDPEGTLYKAGNGGRMHGLQRGAGAAS